MGFELGKGGARYRLLYFHPDPEDGEAVCVALLIQPEPGSIEVLYDHTFARVRCLDRNFAPEILAFCLNDLRESIREKRGDLERVLKLYSPQFSASPERRLAQPVTDSVRSRLLERFVVRRPTSESTELTVQQLAAPAESAQTAMGRELQEFVRSVHPIPEERLRHNVSPREIVGRALPYARQIPLTIELERYIVLLDGIDFKVLRPAKAVKDINEIAQTFWQYGRVEESLLEKPEGIRRVGFVFNGVAIRTQPYRDAHAYALHQFEKEADVAVDVSTGEGKESFANLLQQ